jgi:hypothetical protein
MAQPEIKHRDEVKQQVCHDFQAQLEIVQSMLGAGVRWESNYWLRSWWGNPDVAESGVFGRGIDLSPVMLGFARRRFAAICDVLQVRYQRLPFTSKSMEPAVCVPDPASRFRKLVASCDRADWQFLLSPAARYNIADQLVNHSLRPVVTTAKRIYGPEI